MAVGVVRQFELVIVRGNRAKEFLVMRNMKGIVAIITGSVNSCEQLPQDNRDIHLIYVGRLTLIKQVHQFIAIVNAIRHTMPNVRAVIIGDGPLQADLRAHANELGLARNIEFLGKRKDVEAFLARSKIFMLTSKSEGLSIAMVEAMAAGVVPVVADVGELRDLVQDGINGYLVEPNNVNEYARKALFLLRDHELWTQYSLKAIEAAQRYCDIKVVSQKWGQYLQDVISRASRSYAQGVSN
jgi:glycosyltransferase involved in cell wall biosynthesis